MPWNDVSLNSYPMLFGYVLILTMMNIHLKKENISYEPRHYQNTQMLLSRKYQYLVPIIQKFGTLVPLFAEDTDDFLFCMHELFLPY